MSERITFSGVSGVGKDFVLKELEESGYDFRKVNMGSLIAAELKRQHPTEIEESIDRAYEAAGEILRSDVGRIILNLYNIYGEDLEHVRSNQARIAALPVEKSAVIEAEPELIVARRQQDADGRNRAVNSIEEIEQMQQTSTEVAKLAARQNGVKLKVFKNNGDLDAEDVKDFLEE